MFQNGEKCKYMYAHKAHSNITSINIISRMLQGNRYYVVVVIS